MHKKQIIEHEMCFDSHGNENDEWHLSYSLLTFKFMDYFHSITIQLIIYDIFKK